MSRDVMQKALNALRRVGEYGDIYRYKNTEQSPYTQIYVAIDALNIELAKFDKNPIAWWDGKNYDSNESFIFDGQRPAFAKKDYPIPLYALDEVTK